MIVKISPPEIEKKSMFAITINGKYKTTENIILLSAIFSKEIGRLLVVSMFGPSTLKVTYVGRALPKQHIAHMENITANIGASSLGTSCVVRDKMSAKTIVIIAPIKQFVQ